MTSLQTFLMRKPDPERAVIDVLVCNPVGICSACWNTGVSPEPTEESATAVRCENCGATGDTTKLWQPPAGQ